MRILKNITLFVLCLTGSTLFAQQEGVLTNFMYHMNPYNPAYVGVDGKTFITTSFRQQWSGIKDAPSAETVSFGAALGHNLGIGVSIINSNTFVESQTFTGIDFSYHLKLEKGLDLYLGLKAGGNFYSVNTAGLQTYNVISDPNVASISNFNPNVGVGALLKSDTWQISLAVPRMLNTERANNEDGIVMAAVAKAHYYGTVGYNLVLDPKSNLLLKPQAMVRYVSGAPVSADINTMLSFNDNFEIGATYRTDAAAAALVNFTFKKRFLLGYAYEMSTRKVLASARNTNEFIFRFLF